VLSSKIEGTNVTMGEVLEIEAGADGDVDQPKRDDAEEVLNYRIALSFASNALAGTAAFPAPPPRSACPPAAGRARTRQEPRRIP